MFQSCDGPTIDFYNPNNTNETVENNIDSNPTVNKDVPTENKATSTEVVEKVEEGIQLNLKDLYSNKTFENIDEKKLKAFLDNAYLLVSNAIDSQIRDLYVEDESEEINTKNFR